jgi:branched-chain amino acid transport system substrate-binding protein
MKSKIYKAIFILLPLMLLAIFTDSPGLAAAEPYHLGVALGLSGTGAPYSKEALEGVEIAVNEINAKGGFLEKHRIRLFVRDTQTKPEVAKQVVSDLISNDRVRAVIGTYSSATSLAIKPICKENRVLQIATISNSEDITKLDPSPYTYSVVPNTYMLSKTVVVGVAKLAKKNNWTQYATIASDYAWGRSSQEVQVDLLRQVAPELKLLSTYWPRLGQSRFNSFIVDILAQKPDFVLGSIAGSDNAYWMRDARDYRLFKKVAYPGGLISVTELISQAKSIRRGQYGRCRAPFFAHLDVPMMAKLVDTYKAKFDKYPSDWTVMAYDGVYALKQGIEKAGSIDTETIKDAMKGMTVDTTRGRLFFREIDNQLSCSTYFGRVADDPKYPFPIYHDLLVLKAPDNWRPEAEIRAARNK